MRDSANKPDRWLALTGAMVVLVIALWYSLRYSGNVVDDALISFVYAKSIALGNGAVFSHGERVEGYTNFLWVVALAPLYRVSLWAGADFVRMAVIASALLAALDVVLVFAIGRQLWGSKKGAFAASLAAIGLCVADNSYCVWAMLAMENHLVAFWVLLALYLRGREPRHL